MREEQPLAANHAALACQSQDGGLIIEVPSPPVPPVVRFAAARKRGMEPDDTDCSTFLQPLDQRVALPNAEPAEIEYLKLGPAPRMQSPTPFRVSKS